MPDGKKKSATGLRADGTPRRPNHRDQPPVRGTAAQSRSGSSDSGTRSAGSATGNGTYSAGSAGGGSYSTGGSRPTGGTRSAGSVGGVRSGGRTPTSERAGGTGRSSATLGGSGGTAKRAATTSARPVKAPNLKRALPTGTASIRKPRTSPVKKSDPTEFGEIERLQKVLANAGIGSRRASEELIAAGRVRVDGQVATLGDKVDPINAEIYVDGERVITDTRRVYLAINKPAGVVSTMSDEKGREALADFLGNVPQRVYHVGRLDAESEGLLIMTNDGTLAHKLMHPSYGIQKTYLAEVPGPIRQGLRQQLLEGVELEDGPAKVDAFRVIDSVGKRVLVELVIHEGRKHIVRRLLDEVGHPVLRLIRTSIGPIKIGDLKAGRTRRLTRGEIAALFKAVED
jgi:23S rRNA pseudouridine2605 synthase